MTRKKIKSDTDASNSEAVSNKLRALMAGDAAREHWLRTEGVARYDASILEPSRTMSADAVWTDLEAHMKRRHKRRR